MEWLGEGHLVHFIIDVVERLDVASVEAAIAARDPRGTRPYSPRMMISLLLYGYCVGVIAEPPIGQIKGGQGFRRFSLRGLAKVRCEWALVCLTHNLLKLYRSAAPIPAMA